ncbi:DUF302 domain-containing protein [Profundibacterium mesophilum]|uniref:Levanase n=1 Tax=Profundibacterium mesophilum KAUST100406-0324 TaxID=1037889 RepID=A0A921NTC3_9RHOB|nr:DUF302 domain-containing protein [Profundibacterium mesophilum]KAF0677597.1 levanase [Profundibacterium mesophilum KAUST100406-0324]
MFKTILAAGAVATLAIPAFADIERSKAHGNVGEAMARLEAAVKEAGATIFAKVDHAAGAREAGMTLADSQLLIFGNPALGTPAMQADALAGLYLPLKVLVYADAEGQTWVAYEEVEETLDNLDVDDDAEYVGKMEDALEKLAAAAAGE